MIKGISCLFLAIQFVTATTLPAHGAPQGYVELGKITVPKDFELDTWEDAVILSKGEYLLSLYDNRLGLAYRNKKDGLEYGYRIPTETEKNKDNIRMSAIDVSIIKEGGSDHVRIRVLSGDKVYTSLLRCATEGNPAMLPAESLESLDPKIIAELNTLREVLALLDSFAETIWPGWTEYKELDFSVAFPNRTKLIVTSKERLPVSYSQMDIDMPGGKKVFVSRSREIPGRLGSFAGWRGHGGGGEVSIIITGRMDSEKAVSDSRKSDMTATLNQRNPVILEDPSRASGSEARKKENALRFSRMMTYVHEAFHAMQNWRTIEAEKRGYVKRRGMPDRNFTATLDYSLYSEIEGEALIKAFSETDDARALEHFKDFLVARELKLKDMPAAAAAFDSGYTLAEGTATYSGFKMAMLARDMDFDTQSTERQDVISAAFAHASDFLNKEMVNAINMLKRNTLDVSQKHYIYGAYWSLLLDRFFPSWKQGLFEKNRLLDEVTADLLKMTDEQKAVIAGRLKTDFEYEKIKARHARIFKERDDAIASIANRKGKKFLIDIKHAQAGFDINPRQFIFHKQEQIYPRGLIHFVYGSLRLESGETPMRFILNEGILEWIDTDAKLGEKGYNLKYTSSELDLYKDITLTTKGFSMTAKAIKIVEDHDTVKISVWD